MRDARGDTEEALRHLLRLVRRLMGATAVRRRARQRRTTAEAPRRRRPGRGRSDVGRKRKHQWASLLVVAADRMPSSTLLTSFISSAPAAAHLSFRRRQQEGVRSAAMVADDSPAARRLLHDPRHPMSRPPESEPPEAPAAPATAKAPCTARHSGRCWPSAGASLSPLCPPRGGHSRPRPAPPPSGAQSRRLERTSETQPGPSPRRGVSREAAGWTSATARWPHRERARRRGRPTGALPSRQHANHRSRPDRADCASRSRHGPDRGALELDRATARHPTRRPAGCRASTGRRWSAGTGR